MYVNSIIKLYFFSIFTIFRHLQGTSNDVKDNLLQEALELGIEKATKSASELNAKADRLFCTCKWSAVFGRS